MTRRGGKEGSGGRPIRTPEDLLAFAQTYYAKEFPNPDHEGCPPPAKIEALNSSETLPDEELRQHLFSCSNCFLAYRRVISVRRPSSRSQPVSLRKFSLAGLRLRPSPQAAAAALLALVLALALFLHYFRQPAPPSAPGSSATAQNPGAADLASPPPGSLLANARGVAADGPPPNAARPQRPVKPGRRRPQESPVTFAISIGLREDVMREAEGGQGGDVQVIHLPPRRASLLVQLPDNSSKGAYAANVLDPFGRRLVMGKGVSRDGKMLKVSIDLRGLAEARYRLCVSHASEAPGCYQIMIGRADLRH